MNIHTRERKKETKYRREKSQFMLMESCAK